VNLFNLLDGAATRHPAAGAVYVGNRLFATYAELRRRSLCLADELRRHTSPGDRILIATRNCPEYVEILFATWAAGLVATPVNAKLHPGELLTIIEDATPRLIFASSEVARELIAVAPAGCLPPVVVTGGNYQEWISGSHPQPADVDAAQTAWLFFTSGTTGRPKGAMLSHRSLMAMTLAYLADFDCVEHDHTLIHAAPLSHGSGLYVLPYVARAARHVVPSSAGFDPEEFLDLCEEHPDVAAFMAPTMVRRLRLELQSSHRSLGHLRTLIYGGGPMYLEELRRCLEVFGERLVHLYGQGECPMTITGLRRHDHVSRDETVLASVGWPRSGVQVAVWDESDQPVLPGDVGEVVCRGDVVMSGYWNDPPATQKALRGGWLHTGDMGWLDPDGKLTLCGRSREVIISGGSNIYPREVEEVLLRHADVAEASVAGERNEEWGESVVAFIVRQSGGSATQADLDAHCLRFLARYKRPRRYVFLEELPKNAYGKVMKSMLPLENQ
jgi:acyl-CoA synthetase (AMP-forming)/AMP-acid ligase II